MFWTTKKATKGLHPSWCILITSNGHLLTYHSNIMPKQLHKITKNTKINEIPMHKTLPTLTDCLTCTHTKCMQTHVQSIQLLHHFRSNHPRWMLIPGINIAVDQMVIFYHNRSMHHPMRSIQQNQPTRISTVQFNTALTDLHYLEKLPSSSVYKGAPQLCLLSSFLSPRFLRSGAGTWPACLSLVGRNWLNWVVVLGVMTRERRYSLDSDMVKLKSASGSLPQPEDTKHIEHKSEDILKNDGY